MFAYVPPPPSPIVVFYWKKYYFWTLKAELTCWKVGFSSKNLISSKIFYEFHFNTIDWKFEALWINYLKNVIATIINVRTTHNSSFNTIVTQSQLRITRCQAVTCSSLHSTVVISVFCGSLRSFVSSRHCFVVFFFLTNRIAAFYCS